MISFVRGCVASVEEGAVVIDVGGIGYEVRVSTDVASRLSSYGPEETVTVYTYTYLREDQIALYGFLSKDDLALFKLLITVGGIGPKGGLSLLSVTTAEDLRFAIVSGDVKMISRAPGIGKKTAERVILDLRDKVGAAFLQNPGIPEEIEGPAVQAGTLSQNGAQDALAALMALGYSRAEAAAAVKKCADAGSTEAILHAALRYL